MQTFSRVKGIVAPLDRPNVDTDAIIPKQFLKAVKRTGFGPFLFDEWRFLDQAELDSDCSTRPRNEEFVLNQDRFRDASILLARRNFGCGSSREHAVWALAEAGFQVLISPEFADIFFENCFKNGLLPITLDEPTVNRLFEETFKNAGYELAVDLPSQTITTPFNEVIRFEIEHSHKDRLLNGLDDIAITLRSEDTISQHESQWRKECPWLFEVS